jgi:polar amino acid transport system permease protein
MDALDQLVKTFFDWEAMAAVLPNMIKFGLPNTLILAGSSGVLGCILGMFLAVMGTSRITALRWLSRIYTDVFRGVPAIVIILLIGLGLGPVVRVTTGSTNPFPLAIFALTLMAAAYIGEIFRSGIQSVEKGQLEASRALVNQFIALIKDSSLIYLLGLIASQREIFRIGNDAAANTGNLSPLVAAAFMYLILTVPLTHLVNYIDNRLRTGRPEKRQPDDAAALIGKGAQP